MTLRDSEVAAAVMGVDVQRYKARVFLVSSMYAGLAGVLYALSIGSVAPESFALDLSVLYLAMIVLGGLGSVGGAALGAVFVSACRSSSSSTPAPCRWSRSPARAACPPARRPACCSAWPSSSSSCSSRAASSASPRRFRGRRPRRARPSRRPHRRAHPVHTTSTREHP